MKPRLCRNCGQPKGAPIHAGGHPERCHEFEGAAVERPILFSKPMVLANRAGLKTQTRRIVKGTALDWLSDRVVFTPEFVALPGHGLCPYGVPGDRLWVRETWGLDFGVRADFRPIGRRDLSGMDLLEHTRYQATDAPDSVPHWRPSIHMPRWACRNVYEITDVRVQRLRDISEEDAKAEGVEPFFERFPSIGRDQTLTTGELAADSPYRASYAVLWDEINADRATWKTNPWVWAVSYRPVSP